MCEMRTLADGSVVIVCRRLAQKNHRLPKCRRCGLPAGLLCDGPRDRALGHWYDDEGKQRCSMALCQAHAFTHPDGEHHYCWHHRQLAGVAFIPSRPLAIAESAAAAKKPNGAAAVYLLDLLPVEGRAAAAKLLRKAKLRTVADVLHRASCQPGNHSAADKMQFVIGVVGLTDETAERLRDEILALKLNTVAPKETP